MFDTDVFILGGGPAGLAAAIAARRAGFRVTLADARRPPIDKACGEGLIPDSLRAASQLSIRIPWAVGAALRGVRFAGSQHSATADFPDGAGLGVRRTVLHSLLMECAQEAGVEMAWARPVVSLEGHTVRFGQSDLSARWIVGADGTQSSVRRWAGLDVFGRESYRFGSRRHYRATPRSDYIEVHWGDGCQLYLTPVAQDEICVALLSRDPRLRFDDALRLFPELNSWLATCDAVSSDRGSLAATRRLTRVVHGHVALIGDASGAVDPITGNGLLLALRQAAALGEALTMNDLSFYQRSHRKIMRRPRLVADLMLLLDHWPTFRAHVLAALETDPRLFADLLAMHSGRLGLTGFAATAATLCSKLGTP
ncbi:MAG TPA: FAD-dependent monooxygenase [Bryobacteraceae bacterium]|nr:FAD-dependent monooxygenase [Bryobacteraceae bacterium]